MRGRVAMRSALAGVITFAAVVPLYGQTADEPPLRVWVDLGVATGIASGIDVDLGGVLEVTVEKGKHHAALRAVGLGSVVASSGDVIGDLSILYGRTASASFIHAAVAAGPSVVGIEGCDGVRGADCRTVGLTATAEVAFQAMLIGIGLHAFGNVNSVASYGGFGIVLQAGWMR